MGYQKIPNLYKDQTVLTFPRIAIMEKIHGTSANITIEKEKITYFSGGAKYESFVSLFNEDDIFSIAPDNLYGSKIQIFGEAYGGKLQGMSKTYGDKLRFVAFDCQINDIWIDPVIARTTAVSFGLDFVDMVIEDTSLAIIDKYRDMPSRQAKKNGISEDRIAEGVVIRPEMVVFDSHGQRIAAKHKRPEFREESTPREVDPSKAISIDNAREFANEYVTKMRITHILDKNPINGMEDVRKLIGLVNEDIKLEHGDEFVESKDTWKEIGKKAVFIYREILEESIK